MQQATLVVQKLSGLRQEGEGAAVSLDSESSMRLRSPRAAKSADARAYNSNRASQLHYRSYISLTPHTHVGGSNGRRGPAVWRPGGGRRGCDRPGLLAAPGLHSKENHMLAERLRCLFCSQGCEQFPPTAPPGLAGGADSLIKAHLSFLLRHSAQAAQASGADMPVPRRPPAAQAPTTVRDAPARHAFENVCCSSPLIRLPTCITAVQLARAVEMCTLRHSLETGEQCSAAELAAALQRRGYAARICKSEGGGSGTAAFRNLRHTFLKVEAGSTGAWWAQPAQQADHCDAASEEEAPECIVDCHFACQVRRKLGAWIMKAVHFMPHKTMCAVPVFAGHAASFSASA